MKVVGSIMNRSEERTFHELSNIASDNGLRVFPKLRFADVVQKDRTILTNREFGYYTRSHFDFTMTDADGRPLMVIEYDGPSHSDPKQMERDQIKNDLCKRAGLGLLRIHDRHVTKLYRGMTVLRWIIEVTQLEKAFYDAQGSGQIPQDEPFSPIFLQPGDKKTRFPYWLSSSATESFHSFFKTLGRDTPKGWADVVGNDDNGTGHRMAWLYFDEKVLWTKTAVRRQDLEFPDDELNSELATCELGIQFGKFRKGEVAAISKSEFADVFKGFCARYNARPAHSMGVYPLECSWNFKTGWDLSDEKFTVDGCPS